MESVASCCKAIILKKLSSAVLCSTFAQIIIFFSYVFLINFDIFEPTTWLQNTFRTICSISTWLYILPFVFIIFAQSIICAKDYVMKPVHNLSRFRKFVNHFSLHNLVLLIMYLAAGFLNIWLYLSFSGSKYNKLYSNCLDDSYCLQEEYLFMILSGFWMGIFFFTTYSTHDKIIQFPVLQQYKFVQFKANFFKVFQQSQKMTTLPVLSYFIVYFFWRSNARRVVSNIFGLIQTAGGLSLSAFIFVWLFAILYFFTMNLMSLFYKLFLTETIEFPQVESSDTPLSLNVAINCTDLPIIQHLACLDLYTLSIWSSNRRRVYFSLSQPGDHPHYWKKLFASSVRVIAEFTKSLNDSMNLIEEKPKKETLLSEKKDSKMSVEKIEQATKTKHFVISPFKSKTSSLMSPFNPSSPTRSYIPSPTNAKYKNMRNMTLLDSEPTDLIEVTFQPSASALLGNFEFVTKMREKLTTNVLSKLKSMFAVNYFFGETPEANIHSKLKIAQPIVWLTQALSHISVAALTEDKCGIVQKDLHVLITTLLELKQCIDKLNRLLVLNKRGRAFKDLSAVMKHNINKATMRSLCNICFKYNNCIDDLPLKKESLVLLQNYRLIDVYKNPTISF